MVKKYLGKFYLYLCYFFLYMPIIFMVVFSFNESKSKSVFTKFSLKWYIELLSDESVMRAFRQTLTITFLATIFALFIGTIGAWTIYKNFNPKLKKFFKTVTYLPLILPDIVIAISLIILFVFLALDFGYLTLILAHTIFNVPFVVFSILPKLITFDSNLYDSAMDLGAKPFTVFRKIVLPQLVPNLIVASLISITMSLDDFTVSYFTSGNGVLTLSVKIYSMTKRGISPKINALSTLVFAIVLIISLVTYLIQNYKIIGEKNEKNI